MFFCLQRCFLFLAPCRFCARLHSFPVFKSCFLVMGKGSLQSLFHQLPEFFRLFHTRFRPETHHPLFDLVKTRHMESHFQRPVGQLAGILAFVPDFSEKGEPPGLSRTAGLRQALRTSSVFAKGYAATRGFASGWEVTRIGTPVPSSRATGQGGAGGRFG